MVSLSYLRIALGAAWVSLLLVLAESAKDWSYSGANGPSHWKDIAQACGGSRQSPINIETDKAEKDDKLTAIKLMNFDKSGGTASATMKNNGHSIVVELPNSDYFIEGGGLLKSKLVQFHSHWGPTDDVGSEHTIDGKAYPMEVHFVTYADKYGDFATAVTKEDGLAVLGFFVKVGSAANVNWTPILNLMGDVRYDGTNVSVPTFDPQNLMPSIRGDYFRYKGSLTTPNCNEVVTWTVFREPITISASQMAKFRAIFTNTDGAGTNKSMSGNFRPVQAIGDRKITASFSSGHALSATSALSVSVLLYLTTSLLL